jgi:HK97 family phage prohead protease
MPIPRPQSGQDRDEYIYEVCIPFLLNEGYDREQATAICIERWENRNKSHDMREFKTGTLQREIKDVDVQKRVVQAYYANHDTVDSDGDIIKADAYNKSIKERGPGSEKPRIKHLFNHWEAAGKLMELGQDKKGSFFTSKLGKHTVGKDVLQMYDDEIITEHSHGFEIVDTSYEEMDNTKVRVIEEGVLWEVTSLDKWGANMHTSVKSMEDFSYWAKKIENIEKALHRGKYTDETFELLEIQLKQIKHLLLQPGVQPTSKLEPGKKTHSTAEYGNINIKNLF